jgi:Tol biopolymer transport system component
VEKDYIVFSSSQEGGYRLYLANISTGQRWSLSQFGINADNSKGKLGAYYQSAGGSTTPPAPTPTPTPSPGPVGLLSQGKPAAASSSYNASLGPQYAFDGIATTRWDSIEGRGTGTQWISVDLGKVYSISKVILDWDAAAAEYQIQVSNDNMNWTPIYSTSRGAGGIETLTVSGSGRYVRMYGTKRDTPWGYSLNEFQVFGK